MIARLRRFAALSSGAALVLGATAAWRCTSLPAPMAALAAPAAAAAHTAPLWQGSYHVHSGRSHDSRLTPLALALAARAQGLDYLVLTDHNVIRLPPRLVQGVLLLFERELSTPWGHQVALGQEGAAIVAHPSDGHRPWLGPLQRAPHLVGVEIANISAAARAASGRFLWRAVIDLLAYPWRPDAALHGLYQRDDAALGLWDGPQGTDLVGLCGVDAHGWLPGATNLGLWRMVSERPPTRDPGPIGTGDADAILTSLQAGRAWCAAGPLGHGPRLDFYAHGSAGARAAVAGDSIAAAGVAGIRATLGEPPHALPEGTSLHLLRDGIFVAASATGLLEHTDVLPGTYRLELWGPTPRLSQAQARAPLLYSGRITLTAGL